MNDFLSKIKAAQEIKPPEPKTPKGFFKCSSCGQVYSHQFEISWETPEGLEYCKKCTKAKGLK